MNDSSDKSRSGLAEERTNWAEDRTLLANERTFAGWIRTGMGSLALALGLQALFREAEPTWIAKAVATVFVVIGIVIFWSARLNAHDVIKRLDSHSADPVSGTHLSWISAALTTGAVLVGVVLWIL
jgi:putative membrane protein